MEGTYKKQERETGRLKRGIDGFVLSRREPRSILASPRKAVLPASFLGICTFLSTIIPLTINTQGKKKSISRFTTGASSTHILENFSTYTSQKILKIIEKILSRLFTIFFRFFTLKIIFRYFFKFTLFSVYEKPNRKITLTLYFSAFFCLFT